MYVCMYVDPGNMLRTDEGRLVILDFGLMTKITDDQVGLTHCRPL